MKTCEPVAWRVKDFADGWVLFHGEADARREAEGAGNLVQPLYPADAINAKLLAHLKFAVKLLSAFPALSGTAQVEAMRDAIAAAEPTQEAPNAFEVGKPAPYFCPACQAVPRAGYCKLAGCPTAPAEGAA